MADHVINPKKDGWYSATVNGKSAWQKWIDGKLYTLFYDPKVGGPGNVYAQDGNFAYTAKVVGLDPPPASGTSSITSYSYGQWQVSSDKKSATREVTLPNDKVVTERAVDSNGKWVISNPIGSNSTLPSVNPAQPQQPTGPGWQRDGDGYSRPLYNKAGKESGYEVADDFGDIVKKVGTGSVTKPGGGGGGGQPDLLPPQFAGDHLGKTKSTTGYPGGKNTNTTEILDANNKLVGYKTVVWDYNDGTVLPEPATYKSIAIAPAPAGGTGGNSGTSTTLNTVQDWVHKFQKGEVGASNAPKGVKITVSDTPGHLNTMITWEGHTWSKDAPNPGPAANSDVTNFVSENGEAAKPHIGAAPKAVSEHGQTGGYEPYQHSPGLNVGVGSPADTATPQWHQETTIGLGSIGGNDLELQQQHGTILATRDSKDGKSYIAQMSDGTYQSINITTGAVSGAGTWGDGLGGGTGVNGIGNPGGASGGATGATKKPDDPKAIANQNRAANISYGPHVRPVDVVSDVGSDIGKHPISGSGVTLSSPDQKPAAASWVTPDSDKVSLAGLSTYSKTDPYVIEQRPGQGGATIFKMSNGAFKSYDPSRPAVEVLKGAGTWDTSKWPANTTTAPTDMAEAHFATANRKFEDMGSVAPPATTSAPVAAPAPALSEFTINSSTGLHDLTPTETAQVQAETQHQADIANKENDLFTTAPTPPTTTPTSVPDQSDALSRFLSNHPATAPVPPPTPIQQQYDVGGTMVTLPEAKPDTTTPTPFGGLDTGNVHHFGRNIAE